MVEEDCFPRGGRIVQGVKRPLASEDTLFKSAVQPSPKKIRSSKPQEALQVTEDVFQSLLNVQGTLTYSKIQDGMVILGCIRHITNFSIEIELPGLVFAVVNVTNISDKFTKFMNEKLGRTDDDTEDVLRNAFKVGQMLLVKIMSVQAKEDKIHVEASVNPRDVNTGRSNDTFKKGLLVWCSIQSKADHGYEVNVGVKNCRAFLPFKNIDKDIEYSIGRPLLCTIHKSETINNTTTLRLSARQDHIQCSKLDDIDNLNDLIPGSQVEFISKKVTKYGINGKIFDKFFGYIDATFLEKPLKQLEAYREDQILNAYVLYTEHSTKVTHLSLRKYETATRPNPTLKLGQVVSGEVWSKTNHGIYLRLPQKQKGLITNKRLLKSLKQKPENQDVSELIQSKFPLGSHHGVKILDYNRLSEVYVCTSEKDLVKQKLPSKELFRAGCKFDVRIDKIKEDGIIVSVDDVKGFVPNLYISNAPYSENIKKKYWDGQKVTARVLKNSDDTLLFTLKPALVGMEDNQIFSQLEQGNSNEYFTGVVVSTNEFGAVVVFFGNLKGFLNKSQMGEKDENIDPRQYFFRGQVINVKILQISGENISLTLKGKKTQYDINVGQIITGVVKKIKQNGVSIFINNNKSVGFVPTDHLCLNPSLCDAYKNTLRRGDMVENLVCISVKESLILSRKVAIDLIYHKANIKSFKALKPGRVIRCIFQTKEKNGIVVTPLVKDFSEPVLIKKNEITNFDANKHKFYCNQLLHAKILQISNKESSMTLSIKLETLFDYNVETSVNLFSNYLSELSFLRNFGLENNWDICQYTPGERIQCTVETVAANGGCVVMLPNGAKGICVPFLCPNKLTEGQSIEGVFLSQDFKQNYADVCLKTDVVNRINKKQDLEIPQSLVSTCISEKLLVKEEFVLVVLKQNGNRQLVYLPLKLHENDFNGCLAYYDERKFKICVCGKTKDYKIGFSKKYFIKLEKQKIKKESTATKHNSKIKKSVNKKNHDKLHDNDGIVNIIKNGEHINENIEIPIEDTVSITSENEYESEVLYDNDDIPEIESENSDGELDEKTGQIDDAEFVSDQINDPNSKIPALPGIASFFNPSTSQTNEESSSDEDEEENAVLKKKKKNEDHISEVENKFVDQIQEPQTVKELYQLLSTNTDSAKNWIKLITLHVSATEFDKARTVAKRALQEIDMTLVTERFSVWCVLLNLENMFGTKDSFETTFQDALKVNEPLEVYLKAIEMLAESGKIIDMEEKIKQCRSKYKHEYNMWLEIAKTYYQIEKFKEAREMKHAALKSISDRKSNMTIIVRFALMEFKYGDPDEGCAIFDAILGEDPKKINIWIIYVDQLVKKGKIDQARMVLERSVATKLPMKKMKTLFMKFRKFEEEHGAETNIEEVKKRAEDYISKIVK